MAVVSLEAADGRLCRIDAIANANNVTRLNEPADLAR
jgi:hypothetical protein